MRTSAAHLWGVLVALTVVACATPMQEPPAPLIATTTALPGSSVSKRGEKVMLSKGSLAVDQALPAVALTDTNWMPYTFKADGKVKIVSIVPSIDTRVCEEQTHILSEASNIDPKVQRITLSRDLPPAQRRFALDANLTNVQYLSDYQAGSFGKASGLLMEDTGLLARAVAVVDGEGKVRYLQVVPEITSLPDMQKAILFANQLAK